MMVPPLEVPLEARRLRRSPVLIGAIAALPIGLLLGWWAQAFLDPTGAGTTDHGRVLAIGLELGPWRGAAFVAAYVLAGVIVARRVAREELGSVSGFLWFAAIGQTLGLALAVVDGAIDRPDGLGADTVLGFPLKLVVSLFAMAAAWIPGGVLWALVVRRSTVEGVAGDVLEAAAAYDATNAAARKHQVDDAVLPQDQRARLRIGRG